MLINRNYRYVWLGQAVSLVGEMVFQTTLLLWVATVLLKGKSYAPIASSAVLIVASAATVLVAPVAGVYVDRWNKKRTMLAADLIRAGLIALLAGFAFLPAGSVPVLVVLLLTGLTVALTTAVSQFFNPARSVLIGDVVPEDQRGRAAGYGYATMALASIVGPPLAAPLLFSVGPQWALIANAASFLASYLAIRAVRLPAAEVLPAPRADASVRGELVAGLRLFGRSRALVGLLVVVVLSMLGVGAFNALEVYFIQENLHVGAHWLGILGAVYGGGFLAGSLLGGRLGDRFGHGLTYRLSVVAFAVTFLGYARSTGIVAGIAALTALGLSLGVLNTVMTPIVLRLVPREYQAGSGPP
ncbi:MFS transporter [Longispora sp. NPDC051575]|uniref:MFS transporter n=1 Tax=Longispora sp. NPDC051575 TaxID=3154943 RepID=UPI00342DC868